MDGSTHAGFLVRHAKSPKFPHKVSALRYIIRMMKSSKDILSQKRTHIALLVIGSIFLMTGAFHGNIWFDESYSVAIASKSFADICQIGSGDVHPVLYYFALHVIYLLSGSVTHITAYRVFTVCGAIAMASLGYTHVRRDYGWKVGLLFTFFALFTPYVSFLSIEVRMYSWASCMVMLTFIYACRIMRVYGTSEERARENASTKTWAIFALCSLASAYLHYFALLTVFIINLGLLVFLIAHARTRKHDLKAFAIQAVCEVAAYVPWLFVLASQLGVVSNTYWVNFVFPDTLISLLRYPLYTMQLTFAAGNVYGVPARIVTDVLIVAGFVLLFVILFAVIRRIRRNKTMIEGIDGTMRRRSVHEFVPSPETLPGILGVSVYIGLFVLAGIASVLMHSLMLYFRYLFCAIGPLLFSLAFFLAHFDQKRITACVCALFLGFSLLNQVLIIRDDYSPDNQAPIRYLQNNAKTDELVLSSDIGIEGVTSVEIPDLPQYYLSWQPGNWGRAYECYAPTLTSIPNNWDAKLGDYHGNFWVLGESTNGSRPNDVDDLAARNGIQVVSSECFFRPYTRSYFTITLMYKN